MNDLLCTIEDKGRLYVSTNDTFMAVEDVAKALDVSAEKVRELVKSGEPHARKPGKAWRSDQYQRYSHLAKSFVAQYAGNAKPVDLTPRKKAA